MSFNLTPKHDGWRERTTQEREHALVERQLARQVDVSRKANRRSRWQYVLAGVLALGAVACYATTVVWEYTPLACAALILCAAAALA